MAGDVGGAQKAGCKGFLVQSGRYTVGPKLTKQYRQLWSPMVTKHGASLLFPAQQISLWSDTEEDIDNHK